MWNPYITDEIVGYTSCICQNNECYDIRILRQYVVCFRESNTHGIQSGRYYSHTCTPHKTLWNHFSGSLQGTIDRKMGSQNKNVMDTPPFEAIFKLAATSIWQNFKIDVILLIFITNHQMMSPNTLELNFPIHLSAYFVQKWLYMIEYDLSMLSYHC